jgi:hypothetical protein
MEQSMGGMLSPTYFSNPKNIKDFGDWVYEYRHITLPLAAIPLAVWGGTLGLAVSGLLEVADFMLYVKEKDWLAASMAGAFLVIPGGQLINKIPAVENFTSKTLGPAIKKIVNKLPLNKFEKELANQISENKNWLKENYLKYSISIKNTFKTGKLTGKSLTSSFLKRTLSKYGVKGLLNLVLRLVKMGVWSTKWTIRLTIGGVVATYTIIQLSKKLEEKFGKIKELDNFSDNEKKLTPEQIKQPVDEVWSKSEEKLKADTYEKIININDEQINNLEKSFETWGD